MVRLVQLMILGKKSAIDFPTSLSNVLSSKNKNLNPLEARTSVKQDNLNKENKFE